MKAGVNYQEDGSCQFTVWAPFADEATMHMVAPKEKELSMTKDEEGYFHLALRDVTPGTTYYYRLDGGNDLPDPASHFQPDGVHGPSQVIDHHNYRWQDQNWRGLSLKDMIIYELHVGTFTPEGTFEAIIPRLDEIAATGINALELMPVSQFSGNRNWGYDGVLPYSVQNSYGTPEQFKKFIEACHQRGIAVILDMVYNHLGPEGNYFGKYGPYFTDTCSTPWGEAINYDGAYSDPVRDYFSDNALFWFKNYHLDGLRLDAVHEVYDRGAIHFWEYTSHKVSELSQREGKKFFLIAESNLNSLHVIKSPEAGGLGFDTQWLDDFHHAIYVLLDKEGHKFYEDFGRMEQLVKAYKEGFVHSGDYVKARKRKHGRSSAGMPGERFVAFTQNHDLVGNRVGGERLSMLISFEGLKLAAAAILLSPYVPMLFMGEEYAEDTSFFYFVSHTDPELIEAVRKGRKEEFAEFNTEGKESPDPQSEETFEKSKLQWQKRKEGKHQVILAWYKELIQLRKTHPALHNFDKNFLSVNIIQNKVLSVERWDDDNRFLCLFNLSDQAVNFTHYDASFSWQKVLDSTEIRWQNVGASSPKENTAPRQINVNISVVLHPWSTTLYQAVNPQKNLSSV